MPDDTVNLGAGSQYTEFRAPRTGDTTLTGRGKLLAEVNNDPKSKSQMDERFRRWHNLRIWETIGGKYVLHIGFRTNNTKWERDHDTAMVFKSIPDALGFASAIYNPTGNLNVPPFPEGHPIQKKAEMALKRTSEEYKFAVAKFTEQLGAVIGEQETEVE